MADCFSTILYKSSESDYEYYYKISTRIPNYINILYYKLILYNMGKTVGMIFNWTHIGEELHEE